jgi:pyruvate formate lyase activating enzyme
MRTGIVFNIQRFSIHDGPGIRTTVFLKGCPLRCAWCHNPESQDPKPQVVLLEGRCIRCGACADICPSHICPADVAQSASSSCALCGACVRACPTGAREIIGRSMRVDEVVEEVRADQVFYQESGGGVTVSGGEPLDQSSFACDLLHACRSHGIHTAVDTCGEGNWDDLQHLASEADLILFDLKFADASRHAAYTGGSNERIVTNLRALAAVHSNVRLRVPIIPGVNDDDDEITAMVGLAGSLANTGRVTLLPYHRAGTVKYARLGRSYALPVTEAPSAGELRRHAERFRSAGLHVSIGA